MRTPRSEALGHAKHRVLRGKRHLEIDLRELRLAVGAQVFIAKAARNLEIFIEAGDHQNLLEDLRRLRQRVELARVNAARNQVVPRTLRRRLGHDRRLDLEEAFADLVIANRHRDLRAQREVVLHLGPPQIEVAILQPHLFVRNRVFRRREGRRLRLVQQQQFVGDHFDRAGQHVRIGEALAAQPDVPLDGDDVLGASCVGLVMRRADLLVDDHLGHAGPVAQIEKDQPAMVAPPVHPAHQNDVLPRMFRAKLSTHLRPLQTTQKV